MMQAPRRLSDDPAEPELARALREAQGDVLSPEAVARVQASLAAAGVGGPKPPSPMTKLVGPALAGLGLVGLGLVGLGLVGALGVASLRHRAGAVPMDAPTPVTADVSAAPIVEAARPAPAPDSLGSDPGTGAGAGAGRSEIPTKPKVRADTPAPPAPSPREGLLLLEARRALDTDPGRALALVRAHEAEFPVTQLWRERAQIAAEARQRLEK
jgi:hypothetical protein